MPKTTRSGRALPESPDVSAPLPLASPSPCEEEDEEEVICCHNDNNLHLLLLLHQKNISRFLKIEWSLDDPDVRILEFGIEVVHEAAQRLADKLEKDDARHIRDRSAYAYRTIENVAALWGVVRRDLSQAPPVQELPTNVRRFPSGRAAGGEA